jgi:hypothetical protein
MTLVRRLCPLSLALLACTSIEAREPAPTTTPRGEAEPEPEPRPEPQGDATVKVAIASVVLDEDCRPPAPPETVAPAQREPPRDVPAAPATPPMPEPSAPGVVAPGPSEVPSCNQSVLQVSFDNPGPRAAGVSITSVRVIDPATDRSVAAVSAREPTAWSGAAIYKRWDQQLAPGKQTHASWFLSAPDWSAIQSAVGSAVDVRTHAFELEVTFAIAGKATAVRSPQFTRPPEIVMPPT